MLILYHFQSACGQEENEKRAVSQGRPSACANDDGVHVQDRDHDVPPRYGGFSS